MKLLLLASVWPSVLSFATGPGADCACSSTSIVYYYNESTNDYNEEIVKTGGCVSASPLYPPCA